MGCTIYICYKYKFFMCGCIMKSNQRLHFICICEDRIVKSISGFLHGTKSGRQPLSHCILHQMHPIPTCICFFFVIYALHESQYPLTNIPLFLLKPFIYCFFLSHFLSIRLFCIKPISNLTPSRIHHFLFGSKSHSKKFILGFMFDPQKSSQPISFYPILF